MFTILSQWPRVHILKANKHMSIITDGLKCRHAYTHKFVNPFASDFLPEATCENPFWYICPRSCGLMQENLSLSAIWDCLKRPQVHEKHAFLNPVMLEVSKLWANNHNNQTCINLTLQFHMLHVWNMYQHPKNQPVSSSVGIPAPWSILVPLAPCFATAWTTTGAPESIAAGTRRRRHGDHTSVQQWCLERWAVNGILHILGYFLVGENWISWLTDFVADAIIYTVWDNDPSLYSWPRESGLDHKIDWITAMKPLALVGHIECLGTFSKWVICRDERMTVQIDAYCQCWIHRVHRDYWDISHLSLFHREQISSHARGRH